MQKRSLTASGTPRSGPSVRRRRLVRHPRVGVEVVGRRACAVGLEELGLVEVPGLDRVDRALGAQGDDLAHACGLGTRKPPSATSGALGERHVAGERRPRLVRAQRAADVDHVRRGRHAVEVELGDRLDMAEDLRQLAGHALDLVRREVEAGEARDVEDLLAVDHVVVGAASASAGGAGRAGGGV